MNERRCALQNVPASVASRISTQIHSKKTQLAPIRQLRNRDVKVVACDNPPHGVTTLCRSMIVSFLFYVFFSGYM